MDKQTDRKTQRPDVSIKHRQQRANTNHICFEYFRLEPRQIVDSDLVLLARDCDKNVLTFEHFKLLKASSRYHWINCSITQHSYTC